MTLPASLRDDLRRQIDVARRRKILTAETGECSVCAGPRGHNSKGAKCRECYNAHARVQRAELRAKRQAVA